MLAVLPPLAVVGVFEAKFNAPLPPDTVYEGRNFDFIKYNMRQNGGEFANSPKFIPTATVAYLRPDTLRLSTEWPWVRYRFGRPYGGGSFERIAYLPPANKDSINVESTVSITNVMAIPLALTILAAVALARQRRRRELLILLALATPPLIMATTQGIATRYLGDFFPLLAVGTAFGAVLLQRFARFGRNVQHAIIIPVLIVAIVSIPLVASLATQYNWTYRFGVQ